MFRALYRPSSGCTLSYYKANYTIHSVFVLVNEIPCTSIKFAFKIITVAVKLKSYSNMKSINNIKIGCCDLGKDGVILGIFLFGNAGFFFFLVFRGGTVNWLPGSFVMVNSWQMLRGSRAPTVVVVLISRRWLKYNYFMKNRTKQPK